MRVLIVEDKIKLAGLLRRALRGEGLAVDVATRGEDALWMAAATHYDVIVLDVMLPGIDGVETCRRLRAAEMWSPILALASLAAFVLAAARCAPSKRCADAPRGSPQTISSNGCPNLRPTTSSGGSRTPSTRCSNESSTKCARSSFIANASCAPH